jgi:hypothetical protein
MQLHRVFYVSRTRLVDDFDIQSIVQASRTRNARLDVTGVLAFSGDHFAQLLEGLVPDLQALMTVDPPRPQARDPLGVAPRPRGGAVVSGLVDGLPLQ